MKRSEIESRFKWKIEDIFSSDNEFYHGLDKLKDEISFSSFKGKLNNVETVKECYDKLYKVMGELEVYAVYAMMKRDEDGALNSSIKLVGAVEDLEIKLSLEISFIEP